MPQEQMSVHEAQKHARQWVRSLRAAVALEEVCDAVVDAEDRITMADLHVSNSRVEVEALEKRKVQLEEENLALGATQEDIHRQGKTLAETLATYKKQVESDLQDLENRFQMRTVAFNKRHANLRDQKTKLVAEVDVLRAEKERIEGVVEAFQKVSTAAQGDQE